MWFKRRRLTKFVDKFMRNIKKLSEMETNPLRPEEETPDAPQRKRYVQVRPKEGSS